MKKILAVLVVSLMTISLSAQKRYFTKTGSISFEAGTALEDIDAVNHTTSSIFDAGTGQIEFAVLVKGFEFKRALMQEHFNENYLESDKYPKSLFKGKILNIGQVNLQKNGLYPVTINGTLEMHGIKKEVETSATLTVNGETVEGNSEITVALSDYNITIPGLVKDKISKTVKIKVHCNYNLLK